MRSGHAPHPAAVRIQLATAAGVGGMPPLVSVFPDALPAFGVRGDLLILLALDILLDHEVAARAPPGTTSTSRMPPLARQ